MMRVGIVAIAYLTFSSYGRRVQIRSSDPLEVIERILLAFNYPAVTRPKAGLGHLRSTSLNSAARPRSTTIVACAPPVDKAANLHAWLNSKGIDTSAVKGGPLPGFGLSLISQGVESGTRLLSVPASLHITPSSVQDSPLGKAVSDVVPADDNSAFLALGLLQEVGKGDTSPLAPYIEILPGADKMNGLPLLWTDEDLNKFLSGSHLQATVTNMRNELLAQWQEIEKSVLPKHPESLFPRNVFNAPGYLWAHAICLTRALPFGDELSLIPFLDLANHRAGSKNACSIGVIDESSKTDESAADAPTKAGVLPVTDALQLEGKEGVAVLTAGEAIPDGEQVFIDYGETGWRSSWEMLYTYGFVPGDTKEDWLAAGGRPIFFEGVREDDPLRPQKQALLTALGVDEMGWAGTWVDLRASTQAAVSMAPLLRLAYLSPGKHSSHPVAAKLAEKLASWEAEPRETWQLLQTPLDPQTESLIAGQVIGQCEEALALLPPVENLAAASAPADPEASAADDEEAAEQERARVAARVMLGERYALERCIGEWKQRQDVAADSSAKEENDASEEGAEQGEAPKKRPSRAGRLNLS
mmetsp:Transcript_160312/g.282878  ORF Transcript_160312/g.282878 Transcript_160312/m.282878 type:complete len:585 (+) Transcript_160312:43-1797(+)